MPIFFHKMSPALYFRQQVAENTVYCAFADIRFLILSSVIALSAFMSQLPALWFSIKCGRKVVLVSGVVCQLTGIGLVMGFQAIFTVLLGLILIGFGVGFHVQVCDF